MSISVVAGTFITAMHTDKRVASSAVFRPIGLVSDHVNRWKISVPRVAVSGRQFQFRHYFWASVGRHLGRNFHVVLATLNDRLVSNNRSQ